MTNLKKALQTNEAKGKGVTVSPSYAMKQLMIKMKNEIQVALPSQLASERFQGLLELAHRSGKIKTLYAHEVRKNDEFDIDYGLEQKLTHKPLLTGDRGDVTGYYAVYHLEPSGYSFVFMTKDEVMEHGKKYSKNFEGGIWEKEFDSMAKKTVIKKLLKYAPLSIEMQKAVAFDESVKNSIDSDMLLVESIDTDESLILDRNI